MNFSNAALDLASVREQQERDALIADAIAALEQPGKTECVDCGHAIPKARLAVAPPSRSAASNARSSMRKKSITDDV